jgi:hypothetical protein
MADDFHCSFCGQSRRAARKLISGPKVFICDACVLTCIRTALAAEESKTGYMAQVEAPSNPSGGSGKPPGCSFCGIPHRDTRLALRCFNPEYPERAICAECIGLCVDILDEEFPGQLPEEMLSWPEAARQKGDRRPTSR